MISVVMHVLLMISIIGVQKDAKHLTRIFVYKRCETSSEKEFVKDSNNLVGKVVGVRIYDILCLAFIRCEVSNENIVLKYPPYVGVIQRMQGKSRD